jgi:hypothetical protein
MTKEINQHLYDALLAMFNAHTNMVTTGDPCLNYSEKDFSWVSDDLDIIDANYFDKTSDGDRQEEYKAERLLNGNILLTDTEAFGILTTRLINTGYQAA